MFTSPGQDQVREQTFLMYVKQIMEMGGERGREEGRGERKSKRAPERLHWSWNIRLEL